MNFFPAKRRFTMDIGGGEEYTAKESIPNRNQREKERV